MDYFLQFLVLAFIGIAWWLARRDLTARAAEASAPAMAEMEHLRATIEELTLALEQRAEIAEQRLAERIVEARSLQFPDARAKDAPADRQEERYASIHALAAAGLTDTLEIARRTGIGRGEVELILGLRARRAL